MQWSGAFREFIFHSSYALFFIFVYSLIALFSIRAISVRIYRRESNSNTDFSRLSRIGYSLTVEHEIRFTIAILSLFFLSFLSAFIMSSINSGFLFIRYYILEVDLHVAPILIFTGIFICWFYLSKPIKARIHAARISWGGWLGTYHGTHDRYEYMRGEIQKILSNLDSTSDKVSDVSYRTLELVLQNKGENGCTARAALMDLDPYLWSDYQESLCDRSRSYSYSMVLALCGTIFLVSGLIPRAVGISYFGYYYSMFTIGFSSMIYWLSTLSYLFEYRRERIKDNLTPKVCYEPSVDKRFWQRNSKPRL